LEGYVLHTYGDERHLRNAVASALTIRRYDPVRPIALYTDEVQRDRLVETGLDRLFDPIESFPKTTVLSSASSTTCTVSIPSSGIYSSIPI